MNILQTSLASADIGENVSFPEHPDLHPLRRHQEIIEQVLPGFLNERNGCIMVSAYTTSR